MYAGCLHQHACTYVYRMNTRTKIIVTDIGPSGMQILHYIEMIGHQWLEHCQVFRSQVPGIAFRTFIPAVPACASLLESSPGLPHCMYAHKKLRALQRVDGHPDRNPSVP